MARLSWRGRALAVLAAGSTAAQVTAWPTLASGLSDPVDAYATLWSLLCLVHMGCSVWALAVIGAITVGRWPARCAPAALLALCVAAPPAMGNTPAPAIPDVRETFGVASGPVTPTGRDLHEVAAGDTLWGMAAWHLGPDASDSQIATSVSEWHHVNHDLIGDDPDLIHPGQLLQAPPPRTVP